MSDSIEYKIATCEQTKDFVRQAMESKLYLKTGMLLKHYEWVLKFRRDKLFQGRQASAIGLTYSGDQPVGVVLILTSNLSFYVKPKFRRQGIASELRDRFLEKYPFQSTVMVRASGAKDSAAFLKSGGFNPIGQCSKEYMRQLRLCLKRANNQHLTS